MISNTHGASYVVVVPERVSKQNLATRVLPTAAMWTLLRGCQALAIASLESQVFRSPSWCWRAATAGVWIVDCCLLYGVMFNQCVFFLAAPIKTFTGAPTETSLHNDGNPSFRFSRVFCLPSIDFSVAYLEHAAIKVDFVERVD